MYGSWIVYRFTPLYLVAAEYQPHHARVLSCCANALLTGSARYICHKVLLQHDRAALRILCVTVCRHMTPDTLALKKSGNPMWRLCLVESFETSMKDPPVSSKVQKYTVPPDDPRKALRGQLGLNVTEDSDIFVIGIYRSRTMSELPTFLEHERLVLQHLSLSMCLFLT